MLDTTVSKTPTHTYPADALSDGGRAVLKATVPTTVSVERHVDDDGHATTYLFFECPQKAFALRGDFYLGPNDASWYADLDLDRDGKAFAAQFGVDADEEHDLVAALVLAHLSIIRAAYTDMITAACANATAET